MPTRSPRTDPALAPRHVLEMVHLLHRRGFERLRIAPGLSPSGMAWRCAVAASSAFELSHGALLHDRDAAVHYSSAAGTEYFGWTDAHDDDPSGLADRFVSRFPEICAAAEGPDPDYADWFTHMLHASSPGGLPVAYADWDMPDDGLLAIGHGSGDRIPLPPLPIGRAPHPALLLWERQHEVAPYPDGVAAVGRRIPGTGFFPGAAGLWQEDGMSLPPFPAGGVMVLGHNFDSEAGYRRSLDRGQEELSGPTWRNLLTLLRRADVEPQQCFFTNVYVGLIAGNRATGAFPGRTDRAYVARCLRFLELQLSRQRPSVILVLGRNVLPLLASLSDDLGPWRSSTSFTALDAQGAGLLRGVGFMHDPALRATVVALTHPCLWKANVHRRSANGLRGEAAEEWLIREARRSTR